LTGGVSDLFFPGFKPGGGFDQRIGVSGKQFRDLQAAFDFALAEKAGIIGG
jgi:hypothetical protein